jgi:glycosyltransferase involved in cell wall biosynthesis
VKLSVVIITFNEEANIRRTLASVAPLVTGGNGEIIVIDSGSTDRTCEIGREFGAKVFVEKWQGFAGQKNSAIDKASGDWILSLDADEEVSAELATEILEVLRLFAAWQGGMPVGSDKVSDIRNLRLNVGLDEDLQGFEFPRRNYFLGRWIKHGGFYPDRKLRLFRRNAGRFEERIVHETAKVTGAVGTLRSALIHHAYPTLSGYIDHMNRYSSLGSELAASKGQTSTSIFAFLWNVWLRPRLTFFYNYVLRLGFLDGREGLLLHLYHAEYVSWKYAKAWERSSSPRRHGGTEKR